MNFLRWLSGIVVFFWLMGVIFRFAGTIIHALLIVAAAIFIIDWIKDRSIKKNEAGNAKRQ